MDLAVELRKQCGGLFHGLVLHLYFAGQFAQFTLESQRSAAGFLAAADRMAMVADALRQQEKRIRIFDRQSLCGGAIPREIAAREAGKQVRGSCRESVGETKMVAQPANHPIRAGQFVGLAQPFIGYRMNQECCAAVEIGAHDIDAALGLIPIVDDDIFQLFVQEIFGGFFVGRIDLDEIRQHASRNKSFRFAPFDRGKQTLDTFSCIRAMRKDFFERILAGFEARGFGSQMIEIVPRFGRVGLARRPAPLLPCVCDRPWIPAPSGARPSCPTGSS